MRGAVPLLVVAALAGAAGSAAACRGDEGCSLNGRCLGGACRCFAPWSGASCGVLDELPGPRRAAWGRNGSAPSWGGSAVPSGGRTHLFVAEMTGGCGLRNWGSNMRIVHAVAQEGPLGPYRELGVATPPQSTNPQAIVDANGAWWLFHIGLGSNKSAGHPCPPPLLTAARPRAPQQQVVHRSSGGPNGPWVPHSSIVCNNPAPALARDGSARLLCDDSPHAMSVHKSTAGFGGPWESHTIVTGPASKTRPHANWEDPFLWQDARGHWHALCHVYTPTQQCGGADPSSVTPECNYISGHMFSRDGLTNWTVSEVEPFSFSIVYSDNTSGLVATR